MTHEKLNSFGKLGRLITKRKFAVIGVWILLLAIILPVVLTASGYTSLTFNSSTDTNTESGKASNIIKEQFQNSVSNDSLILVISTDDASSIDTQEFIDELVDKIENDPSITGLENVTSLYTILIPALNQTNEGVYLAYNNGNLTYNLLYSVPTVYSKVWYAAYTAALNNSLVPGLNQTNQAVYELIPYANQTYNLLYSVPAIFLNVWVQTYNVTLSVDVSNLQAYTQTATILQTADPTAYATYTSQLLYAYNATWSQTFLNPTTASLTPDVRASLAANITNQAYINAAFASNQTAKAFATALISAFSLDDYISNTQAENNAQLETFAINYIADQADSSSKFVRAAYNLGSSPSTSNLLSLAKNVIWYPENYGMDTDFIATFNKASYDNTASILDKADHEAYVNYTSHMLSYFNASWASKVPISPGDTNWINSTASSAVDVANMKFIANYLSDNQDFANGIKSTFTLQDYLNGNTTYTNAKLYNFSISYVANESGLSEELIKAVYNMGENATLNTLRTLASDIVYDPEYYNVGEQLNTAISSFVPPSNDVTLVSVTFGDSNEDNLLAIREITQKMMAQNPIDITAMKVTGSDAIGYDYLQATNSDLDLILPVTIALLVIATALFFRSIVTPIITLGTIGIGLGVSQIFPYLIGTYVNPVDYTTSTVLLTVLLGVGTDYSIFIIARHREERINGLSVFDSIKQSITWAGESIVTSGATVIISFLALATTSMVMLQTMGLIIGLGVIVTLIASLTVAPALTAILGDRIFWPNSGERFKRYSEGILEKNRQKGGYFARSGAFSVKHGKVIILVAILVTVPAFYLYSTTIQTYDVIGSASDNLESIGGMNTLTDSFGGGRMLPTYVVVTFSNPILYSDGSFNIAEMSTLNNIASYITNHDGVDKVTGPTNPYGTVLDYQTITNDSDSTTYSSMISCISDDNCSALITLQFTADPYSTTAMDVAQDIRTNLHEDYDNAANVSGLYLGGTTGAILDQRNNFQTEFNQIVPVVALGVGIVLFLVLGSLILPIFAVLSVLMSIVWTLAATILVFQSFFGYGMLYMTPLILFVLLLGLGMDYNIFILTRIREEAAKGQSQNEAIVNAIQQTGGIITAAAIILAGSLGALMLSSNLMLSEMGFALGFSILIDALVVRTYLVPAVMAVFGKWNWYNPIKRLRRVKENKDTQAPNATEAQIEQKPQ
jgi:RND superfamily putative drug exporter